MPHAVLDTARNFLRSFITPRRILVAVSGGSDSMGLLVALHSAIAADERRGFSLAACTVDHALRPQSAREAEDVAAFCAALGIAHRICRWEGAKPSTGIQAAARNKRYELLAEAADALGADCIATGHTRDDQQETVAMRIARGKGGAGDGQGEGQGGAGMAAAMLYGRRIWVLRPFLGLARAEIRSFLQARGVSWIDDPSNANPAFERVRVRARIATSGGCRRPWATGASAPPLPPEPPP